MLWFLYLLNTATYASAATSAALNPRQIQWPTLPNNLTEDVLQQLTQVVIPRCERLRGDPGCWCGNHDPVHYCAICMSNPADNQTTPEQTQAATAGHNAFHVACNAYEEYINGTASTTSTSMISTTSQTPAATAVSATSNNNKTPVGPIVGGVVGGVVGLALVVGIIYLLAILLKRNDRRSEVRPSSVSYMSSEHKSPNMYATPYPQLPASYPGQAPGHISPHNNNYVPPPEPMNPMPVSQPQPPIQHAQN
ncbi:hypothetical protein OPQ81_010518 [Rhizoctonia solani]|nr:hypothetical protein OPQ81_010518 [Rhizoctonia solani]